MMKRSLTNVSPRLDHMVGVSPEYVQTSEVWAAIMNAKALELDRQEAITADLQVQLSPYTATWGLVYWEQSVGLTPRPTEDYDIRRPPILARLRNSENFSLAMIRQIADDYGDPVDVSIDHEAKIIRIVFHRGIPTHIRDFQLSVENLKHAHFGADYTYQYVASENKLYLGTRHTIGAFIIVRPYLLEDYDTSATMYAAAFSKFGVRLVVGPK